ncbi:hypothetical protein UFOVP1004_4 [uncultured Caudovirales phage]|uniref:Archaeal primase DnaG/twinkle, TOPRIM domain n=1 Tax=uncultured Caudovirales phage TaxID=2100421 RepID=A0A6J5Q328_9CAUD|nr:hypothetical protein UFOVP1004_4 [uncultured Caudovirales phage]
MALIRVNREHPCPVCGRPEWCSVTDNGEVIVCMRTESERQASGGSGWIHFATDPHAPPAEAKRVHPKLTADECEMLARECYQAPEAQSVRAGLSVSLGVSVSALESLRVGAGSDYNGERWSSWPCRDGVGQVVGLTRRYSNGSKKTFPGSRAGVFCSRDWHKSSGPVLILEGGSDVAAAIDSGLCAIGRPSNTGGVVYLLEALRLHAAKRPVLVIGENDRRPERRGESDFCPADCTGCANCWPGKYGAESVAGRLGIAENVMLPPDGMKDFREMVSGGVWFGQVKKMGALQ